RGAAPGNLAGVRHIILVLSGKGGVGKSTISTELALALRHTGKKVGLLDVDLCGPSIPRMLRVQGRAVHQCDRGWLPVFVDQEQGISLMSVGFLLEKPDEAVVWRGPKKNALIKQFVSDVAWGPLDYLVVDTPPGTSDEHMAAVDALRPYGPLGALVVTTPQVLRERRVCGGRGAAGHRARGEHERLRLPTLRRESGEGPRGGPAPLCPRSAPTSSPGEAERSWPDTPECPSWVSEPEPPEPLLWVVGRPHAPCTPSGRKRVCLLCSLGRVAPLQQPASMVTVNKLERGRPRAGAGACGPGACGGRRPWRKESGPRARPALLRGPEHERLGVAVLPGASARELWDR
uniref:NUBP iron-sulfur cluster assembly factor 2, cytosolic n=1 Tax=Sus scrofa TaxID=9823 RepID=A0A8W4FLD3_PIG